MKVFLFGIWMVFSFSSCKDAEPATYYLPEGYEGIFAVVYSQRIGEEKTIRDGRRQFFVPSNGVLLTQFDFSDGGRDDLFLIKTPNGYDTLKNYIPNQPVRDRKFDSEFYKKNTTDSSQVAVNFRQIVNTASVNNFCSFEYELITIGRASTLNDSLGKSFSKRLDKYLQDSVCNQ